MSMISELVKELREASDWHYHNTDQDLGMLLDKSADTIEMLSEKARESKQEWIPCSERLPEEDGHYIVYAPSYSGGSSSGKEIHDGVMFSRFKSGKWSIEVGYHKRPNCVKAWMTIEPWKGAGDE